MAFSDAEKIQLWNRLTKLELSYNALLEALDKAITTESFNELSTILQTQLDSMNNKVDDLVARVDALEDIPLEV
jgi:predicted nuclease with TOPRIM domain